MGIQVARRNSFQQTHDTIWDLSYVCSGLFCKPILCFVSSCGIRVASMSSVDFIPFPKWFSHIPMWILILRDHRVCHLNSFSNRCVSLRDDPIILPIRKINSKFSQRCLFRSSQVAFVFPPSHPFSSRTQIS